MDDKFYMFPNLSNNLNLLMAKVRVNSNELARLTGVPATNIKRIRNNENSNPTILTLLPLARYFGMTVSELLGAEDIIAVNRQLDRGQTTIIPLLTWDECKNFNLLDYAKVLTKILTTINLSSTAFALQVEEEKLKFFPLDSLLIIDPSLSPSSQDFVLIIKPGQQSAEVKRYIKKENIVYLQSLDGESQILLNNDYRFLGVVVQCRLDLKQL